MRDEAFSRRAVLVLVAVGVASLLIGVFTGSLSGGGAEDEVVPDGYGLSAIGHRAFLELLRERDVPLIARRDPAGPTGDDTVLLLLEPDPRSDAEWRRLERLVRESARVLLVLPKWIGTGGGEGPGWVEEVELRARADVERVLELAARPAALYRGPSGDWNGVLSRAPSLGRPQLVEPPPDAAVLALGSEGALVLERREGNRHLLVLSDPDVIANHGLGRGANAELAVALVEHLRDGDTPVVVDESLHGHVRPLSITSELLRFPLVLLLLQLVVVTAGLLWAGVWRFGPPSADGPELAPGKQVLVENTASLLVHGGHADHLLARYGAQCRARVATAYHLPADLTDGERRERLAALGPGRAPPPEPDGTPDAYGLLEAAGRVHRWREEMLHGTGRRPRAG